MTELEYLGFGWVALNVVDYPWRDWARQVDIAKGCGLAVVPWGRLGVPGEGATSDSCYDNLLNILDAAWYWETPYAIVNAETELKPSSLGGVIRPAEIAQAVGDFQIAVSTEGFLYDIDWTPLTRFPVLLQLFPEDMKLPYDAQVLDHIEEEYVFRARSYGFKNVGVTYQAYRQADPAIYPSRAGNAWSIYTGDDVGAGNFARWAAA